MESATSSSDSRDRATSATLAPWSANSSAMDLPMPREAPVMMAVLPCRSMALPVAPCVPVAPIASKPPDAPIAKTLVAA